MLTPRVRAQKLGPNAIGPSFGFARKELAMTEKREYQLLAHDFPRKDGIARVTGCELARAVLSLAAARVEAIHASTTLARCSDG